MSTSTVRISASSHQILCALAEQTGQTMMGVLDLALNAYRRKVFLDELNAGYAALRADPKSWAQLEAERNAWDATLMDGLDRDERWTKDGRCLPPKKDKR